MERGVSGCAMLVSGLVSVIPFFEDITKKKNDVGTIGTEADFSFRTIEQEGPVPGSHALRNGGNVIINFQKLLIQ